MMDVFNAVYQEVQGSAFLTSIGGRFFPLMAPVGTAVPFAVFSVPSDVDDPTLGDLSFSDMEVHIDCVAETLSALKTIVTNADAIFNNAVLSFGTGISQCGNMKRVQKYYLSDENVFRTILEYEVTMIGA